jgi:hypothetical protein
MKLTNLTARESTMSNDYIEPRPKSRPGGDPIDDYGVEDHADHLLATFKTQREAIEWAKKNGHKNGGGCTSQEIVDWARRHPRSLVMQWETFAGRGPTWH